MGPETKTRSFKALRQKENAGEEVMLGTSQQFPSAAERYLTSKEEDGGEGELEMQRSSDSGAFGVSVSLSGLVVTAE